MNSFKSKIEKILRKYRKHDYQYGSKEIHTGSKKMVTIPVYRCTKCGDKLGLESWQMKQLPRDMKYGCVGYMNTMRPTKYNNRRML